MDQPDDPAPPLLLERAERAHPPRLEPPLFQDRLERAQDNEQPEDFEHRWLRVDRVVTVPIAASPVRSGCYVTATGAGRTGRTRAPSVRTGDSSPMDQSA